MWWTMDFNEFPYTKSNTDFERSSRTVMVIMASVLIASVFQIASWDKYALDIIPYQVKGALSATSPQDWEDQAKMCWDLKKWDCVESEYTKAAQNNKDHYPRLGHYLMRRLKFDKAASAFRVYFNNGGEDLEAAAAYAKALGETDQFQESFKYFDMVLESGAEAERIPVVLNYVKVLMKNEKFAHAQRLIEEVRRKNPAGSQFMEAEYNQIKNLMTASR
jgi:tetratricopeptide (TPR) repeat protein